MDIQKLITAGIREKLYYEDYLVLPGFGGFVLRHSPSKFTGAGNTVLPPSRVPGFNAQLRQNDGILVSWLQEKLDCTAPEALTHVLDFAEYCRSILNARRRFTLDGVGFFYIDQESNICFEPASGINYNKDSFGLDEISLPVVDEPLRIPLTEKVFEDRTHASELSVKPVKKRYGRSSGRLVATGMIVLFVLASLFVLLSGEYFTGGNYASLLPISSGPVYIPIQYPDLQLAERKKDSFKLVSSSGDIAALRIDEGFTIPVRMSSPAKENHRSVKSRFKQPAPGKYVVVLGCFEHYGNAVKMSKRLNQDGTEAAITGKSAGGLFIVSYGSFDSKELAVSEMEVLKKEIPGAWIKRQE